MSDPEFHYIADAPGLQQLVERLSPVDTVALDTEADSLHHYYEKVCLIQLTIGNAHYIIDPLAGIPVAPLLSALVPKNLVFHGADYDLRMLRLSFNFEPHGNVFDTMLAAQILGYKQLGLAALIKQHFNVELPKHGQKADWSKRPIPRKLIDYAYGDTRFLLPLAEILQTELERLGRRTWHVEACRQVVKTSAEPPKRSVVQEWRIKGSNILPLSALVLLKELWAWREAEAQRADIPPFRILSNQSLISLIQWAEENPLASADQWPHMPERYSPRRIAALSNALAIARTLSPESALPPPRETPSTPYVREDTQMVEALRQERDRIATKLELDPAILAPKAALIALARSCPRTIQQIQDLHRLLPWQVELLGAHFLDVIQRITRSRINSDEAPSPQD